MDSAAPTWDSVSVDAWVPGLIVAVAGGLAALYDRAQRAASLFTNGSARIPKRFEVESIVEARLPVDAAGLVDSLASTLTSLGFVREAPVEVPSLRSTGHQVLLVPFVHEDERALFLMGLHTRWARRSELLLHIVTPLGDGQRIETSTLGALLKLRPPASVDLRAVLDATSVEEIWSRHRRALTSHERAARAPVRPEDWCALAAESYDAWIQAAVRAQRVRLTRDGVAYRLRAPS